MCAILRTAGLDEDLEVDKAQRHETQGEASHEPGKGHQANYSQHIQRERCPTARNVRHLCPYPSPCVSVGEDLHPCRAGSRLLYVLFFPLRMTLAPIPFPKNRHASMPLNVFSHLNAVTPSEYCALFGSNHPRTDKSFPGPTLSPLVKNIYMLFDVMGFV